MNTTNLNKFLLCHGPEHRLVYIKFTPNGTSNPTVDESHGFSSTVTYSDVGVYIATVSNVGNTKDITVLECMAVPGDTNYHELKYAVSDSARTITVTHRTVTYANIVSAGPAASNTCGQITLAALVRVSS
jgi:hypothetical protein